MIKNVEEVINMDVQRSFTHLKGINPEILTNILKTYAFVNQEIEYCQGMNFVAGLLYLMFNSEDLSFKAMQEIIERFDMAELFNEDLPKLKLFFYQFDRLLAIQLPNLHSHFKVSLSQLTSLGRNSELQLLQLPLVHHSLLKRPPIAGKRSDQREAAPNMGLLPDGKLVWAQQFRPGGRPFSGQEFGF